MRNFDVKDYIEKKSNAINEFFLNNGLDSVVVGISGGVDSAVVLLLYLHAAAIEGSPIKQVRALTMPIYGLGTSGQSETVDKANELFGVINSDKLVIRYCDLTTVYKEMIKHSSDETDPWADGQMASVLRTPMFYYQAAIMQKSGLKSLVSGTTNRDEGSYIGFFGKASDGMVDIQPIADLHKSEVYKVATEFGVPECITSDEPKGDVWDARTDIDMIGAPYWFLQEYIESMCKNNHFDFIEKGHIFMGLLQETHRMYIDNIDKLHNTNKHKYLVGMPSHFLDIPGYDRKVPNGWN